MIRVGLLGASGRMGTHVAACLAGEFKDGAELAVSVSQGGKLETLLGCDVVIDFSLPEAMEALADLALAHASALPAFVVGSTGWKVDGRKKLEALARKAPVITASNFSTGVTALLHVLKSAAPLLEKLGYTPVIVEAHHKHKKDAPSGTAISIQRVISPEGPGNVQTHSVRAGETVGDHEVTFHGPADRISMGHFAQDRTIFARGAIQAALWLSTKRGAPAMFSMDQFFQEKYL